MIEKQTVRTAMLAKREALGADYREQATAVIGAHLADFALGKGDVAGYVATRGEVDILPALFALASNQKLALPVVAGPGLPLIFRRFIAGEALVKGKFGIETPHPQSELVRPQLLVVPLVAFDSNFNRLGYGAGYYDRTIAGLRQSGPVICVGVAFSRQYAENLPCEPHDQKLDAIITENGTLSA